MNRRVYMYNTDNQHRYVPSFIDVWTEGITPLIVELFVIYLWSTPLTSNMLQIDRSSDTDVVTIFIATVISLLTFMLNICIHPYLITIHAMTHVSKSPIFRAVWTFTCAVSIRQLTGFVGIIPFTILVFLPLIYVRVSQSLASISAVYAVIYFGVCAVHGLSSVQNKPSVPLQLITQEAPTAYTVVMSWVVFIASSVHHMTWVSSHTHTSDPSEPPVISYLFLRWRNSGIPIAIFRTLVVSICMVVVCKPTTYNKSDTFQFMQALFLFLTISTLTAWTHCQHTNVACLRSILLASVTTAVCGMLVDNVEQMAFLYMSLPLAIFVELVLVHRHNHKLHTE